MSKDQETKDQEVKEKLLGVVKKLVPTGGHIPDYKKIAAPLEEGVARFFCQGCGSLYELTQEGAEDLAKRAGSNITSFNDIYFEVKRCTQCDEEFRGVRIKNKILVH